MGALPYQWGGERFCPIDEISAQEMDLGEAKKEMGSLDISIFPSLVKESFE